jgi:thiosulfate dehydrogenase
VGIAAAFIRTAMPQNQPGSLTAQQAFDLATYINSHTRPDFAAKSMDWPNGDAPPDVPYPLRSRKTD